MVYFAVTKEGNPSPTTVHYRNVLVKSKVVLGQDENELSD